MWLEGERSSTPEDLAWQRIPVYYACFMPVEQGWSDHRTRRAQELSALIAIRLASTRRSEPLWSSRGGKDEG